MYYSRILLDRVLSYYLENFDQYLFMVILLYDDNDYCKIICLFKFYFYDVK